MNLEEEEIQETTEEKPNKNGKRKWVLLVLVLIVIGSSVAGYFLAGPRIKSLIGGGDTNHYSLALDTFTVNLSDLDYRRYLRADITLEYSAEKAGEEIEKQKYRIRDKIITILNQKTVDDFSTDQRFESVRKEITKAINGILPSKYQVDSLYFENFIIQ